jgi:hypothetical protein
LFGGKHVNYKCLVILPLFHFCSLIQALVTLGNWLVMENRANNVNREEEMEDSEFLERLCLVIIVSVLNSSVSFALDTLAQHRVMVGEL